MMRVLVSGASGIVGYGVLRSLRAAGAELFLVGTSIYQDSVAPAFCDVFELAPATRESGYMPWLLATLRRHRIDMLIPGIEDDMYRWIEHLPEIEATGAFPLLNSPDLVALCKDKWAFYLCLKQAGLACAIDSALEGDFATLKARFGVPFILKPRRGYGSKGIVVVASEDVFEKHRAELGSLLMTQAFVGDDDEEYTIGAFGDGCGGYFTRIAMRRKLSTNGFTERAEVVDWCEVNDLPPAMDALCRVFHPLGPTNFQFRRCIDGPKLLEINPRISSSTSIRSAFGYNESLMALRYFKCGERPVQPEIRRGRAVRYIEEKIFYEDGVYL